MKGFYKVSGAAVNPQVSINNDHFFVLQARILIKNRC